MYIAITVNNIHKFSALLNHFIEITSTVVQLLQLQLLQLLSLSLSPSHSASISLSLSLCLHKSI